MPTLSYQRIALRDNKQSENSNTKMTPTKSYQISKPIRTLPWSRQDHPYEFPEQACSFRGPGGVVRGPGYRHGRKSARGNWPLWSPMVSRGHQGPPVDDGMDNRYSSKLSSTKNINK